MEMNIVRIAEANKENNVVVTVTYGANTKEYGFVRKTYKVKGSSNRFAIIQGKKIVFNEDFDFISMEDAYETSGKKVLGKGTKENSYNVTIPQMPAQEPVVNTNKECRHAEMDTIKTCIENDIPVYLFGPAGSGKNYTIKKIAEELNLEFYFTNSVQQEYKITGFIDAGGNYHETEFYKAFRDGGLFFLDEMDASIPEVLTLLNAAIANRYFEFPNGRIEANENFRVIAAGNTLGRGADEQYTGRMVLDAATLDRFLPIEFGYDTNVELNICKGDSDLVNFIHQLREQAENFGFNATFSYRCMEYIVKLNATAIPTEKILKMAVFKGMPLDDIRMFHFEGNNKYTKAAKRLAA